MVLYVMDNNTTIIPSIYVRLGDSVDWCHVGTDDFVHGRLLIQSDPIRSDPIQSNPIQSNPIQSNPIQSDPIRSISYISVLYVGCHPMFEVY